MTTSTTTLTDFLLARIDEDEAVARGAYRDSVDDDGVCHEDWTDATTAVMWGDLPAISGLEADYLSNHIARHDPARVLAECEAKRRIVEALIDMEPVEEERKEQVVTLRWACEMLAHPYADHPDYNPDWRP